MIGFSGQEYAEIKKWISSKIESGRTWDDVAHLCVGVDEERKEFDRLKDEEMLIPSDMRFDDWHRFVEDYRSTFQKVEYLYGLSDENGAENRFATPSKIGSAWVGYKNHLHGYNAGKRLMSDDAIEMLENNCHWILNRLKLDTRDDGPVKGLVMGSVQSGKTANMIGLTTMAADYDWNVFIILTGTIENLRKQTEERFKRDLAAAGGKSWHILDCKSNSDFIYDVATEKKISPLNLRLNGMAGGRPLSDYTDRYVFVCLKNSVRLRNLILWLHSKRECAAKMRILLIDDEADQASVNTRKMDGRKNDEDVERTRVNEMIIDLVKGLDEYGREATAQFQAVDYISYTATPYANVLNEAYKDSLYPRDFICALPESNEYFGLRSIWGSKEDSESYPGLNVIRTIPDAEAAALRTRDSVVDVSELAELQNSLAWFLCSAAALRHNGYKKPISMLIHTTSIQSGHFELYDGLSRYFAKERSTDGILKKCREIYEIEKSEFTARDLADGYPNYGRLGLVKDDFPDFEDIRDDIAGLIGCVKSIEMDSDGKTSWNENAIHLCVDNCRADNFSGRGIQLRIVYPADDDLEKMDKAPVFIVMGGNTLSRGLTLEGLVCTYFARDVNQADTLMQMARWFGYHRGYELYQRIWMTDGVREKFELMEEIDERLKSEFVDFMRKGKSPSEFGPRVMASYKIKKFMLTARNKSQSMVPAGVDYTGDSLEVTKYENSLSDLEYNIRVAEEFLEGISCSPSLSEAIDSSYVWYDVDSRYVVSDFLMKYKIFDCCDLSADIPQSFLKWLAEMNGAGQFLRWNVAVAGNKSQSSRWRVAGADVGKIERSRLRGSRCIDIGALRSGVDALSDVRVSRLSEEQTELFRRTRESKENLIGAREDLGLGDSPLLLLYRIDKDKGQDRSNRAPLNAARDIVGFSVIVSGRSVGGNGADMVRIKMPR